MGIEVEGAEGRPGLREGADLDDLLVAAVATGVHHHTKARPAFALLPEVVWGWGCVWLSSELRCCQLRIPSLPLPFPPTGSANATEKPRPAFHTDLHRIRRLAHRVNPLPTAKPHVTEALSALRASTLALGQPGQPRRGQGKPEESRFGYARGVDFFSECDT